MVGSLTEAGAKLFMDRAHRLLRSGGYYSNILKSTCTFLSNEDLVTDLYVLWVRRGDGEYNLSYIDKFIRMRFKGLIRKLRQGGIIKTGYSTIFDCVVQGEVSEDCLSGAYQVKSVVGSPEEVLVEKESLLLTLNKVKQLCGASGVLFKKENAFNCLLRAVYAFSNGGGDYSSEIAETFKKVIANLAKSNVVVSKVVDRSGDLIGAVQKIIDIAEADVSAAYVVKELKKQGLDSSVRKVAGILGVIRNEDAVAMGRISNSGTSLAAAVRQIIDSDVNITSSHQVLVKLVNSGFAFRSRNTVCSICLKHCKKIGRKYERFTIGRVIEEAVREGKSFDDVCNNLRLAGWTKFSQSSVYDRYVKYVRATQSSELQK